jgi:superfamily II DNA/RNA helicase
MQEQIAKLKESPDIIVATPSKLVQHLKDGGILAQDSACVVV